jgi:hypothetical protein
MINLKKEKTTLESCRVAMMSRREDLEFWMNNGTDFEGETGSFYDYDLEFSFIPAESIDKPGHFRYLLSCGGPQEQVEFYPDGKILFRYLDWFVGESISVTSDPVYRWLRDYFSNLEMLPFDQHFDELYLWHDQD